MATEPTALMRGKILVVDDNPVIQRAVYFALRDHGYQVVMSGAVFDAINIIREEQPDLVLVDLSFPLDASNIGGPLADGFFFMHWIRRTPEVEDVPVMIISATEPDKYQERIADLEIKACLHKPLKKDDLLTAIQKILDVNAATDRPDQS
jgi:two-component system, sensor histidine kinase SagS